jgi:soluble lytic murein transglycosylase-like protein
VESEFKQYEGGTHGERGIFQIMPCEFADYNIRKNYYDIDLNTEMGFRVLNGKYKKHKDYKKAIMAYNGLVKFKSGHYSQKYWRAFEKRRIAIDLVLGHE